MRTINREIVSALLISKDKKVFMGKKDPHAGGVYSDCWHIPGGGVEGGESLEETLAREIKEETGIDILPYAKLLVSSDGKGESKKIIKETGEEVLVKMQFNVFKVELTELAKDIKVQLNDDLVIKLTPPSVELFKQLKSSGII